MNHLGHKDHIQPFRQHDFGMFLLGIELGLGLGFRCHIPSRKRSHPLNPSPNQSWPWPQRFEGMLRAEDAAILQAFWGDFETLHGQYW